MLAVLTGLVGVDPTAPLRRAPDWSGWLTGQQRVDRVMSRVAPPVFLATAATAAGAALLAARRGEVGVATARALAAVCTGGAVVVTLRVNEPANTRLRAWRPADAPPADWREVRARWDRGHAVRRALVVAAALAGGVGLVLTRGGRDR